MAHPYSANTTVAPAATDLRGLLAAASHHLGAALGALALHDVTLKADTTADDSLINFCEASLARLSLAEPQQTAMELDTTAMDLDLSVPRPRLHHRESPKERVARRKLLLNLHTPARPKNSTCSSSSATPAADPAAVLLIDRTLAPARNVRARGF